MPTEFLIIAFFIALLGIVGLFGLKKFTLSRHQQKRIQEVLQQEQQAELGADPAAEHITGLNPESTEAAPPKGTTGESITLQELRGLLNRAEVFLSRKEFSEAEKLYIKILAFYPDHPVAIQKLAYLYLQTHAYAKAESLYRQLAEFSGSNPGVHTNLGLALFHQKKFDESITAYEHAITLEPNRGARYANLGQVYFAIKDMETAIECFQMAVKKEPRNLSFLYLLADATLEAQHFVDAKKWYARILDLSPYDEDAKNEVRRLKNLGF